MTPKQLLHLENHLKAWRDLHPDLASLQTAYRQRVVDFTLNSMALEREPIARERLLSLLNPSLNQLVR